MARQIKFVVYPDGKVKIDVEGGRGASCTELTAVFEQHFGEATDQHLKEEYYVDGENRRIHIDQENA